MPKGKYSRPTKGSNRADPSGKADEAFRKAKTPADWYGKEVAKSISQAQWEKEKRERERDKAKKLYNNSDHK